MTETAETPKAKSSLRTILGEKVGMTQLFHSKNKNLCAVTIVKAGPCTVLRVKSSQGPDGYDAVQLAYGSAKEKNLGASVLGQFKKAGASPAALVREIRTRNVEGFQAGQKISIAEVFKNGDYVDVSGISKGHGFAGVMKRHGFRGLPASHGASDKQRSPGSLASRRSLGRVLPGQRMAGHMGHERVTVHKIEVIEIEPEQNLIYLGGSVPGPVGGLVEVSETVKPRKFRLEQIRSTVKKGKMGNIIGKAPSKPAKK